MNGWAPAQVTFDADGNVTSVTVAEPRFTPDEKALLLASRRDEHAHRGRHGLLLSESTDPKNQGKFEVEMPLLDFAQQEVNRAQSAYEKAYPGTDMDSLIWRVKLKE